MDQPVIRTMQDAWQRFERDVLLPQGVIPGSIPYQEIRRAYYFGAATFFHMMQAISHRYSVRQSSDILTAFELEFKAFEQELIDANG